MGKNKLESRYLTSDEVAEMFQVTKRTIENWRQTRDLPCHKLGRYIRFSEAAVKKWFDSQKQ